MKKLKILLKIHCILFLRDIHEEYLWLEDADNEKNNFATELKNSDKDKKQLKKMFLYIT